MVFRGINNNRVNCSHDRECDCGHPPHCKYIKKENVKWERIVHSSTHKRREVISQSSTKRKRNIKRVRKRKGDGCNSDYCKSPSKDMGNLESVGQSKIRQRDDRSVRFSHQSLERARSRVKFPSLNVIQTGGKMEHFQMHHRMTKGPQSGMSSKKSLQDAKHTHFTKSSSRKKDTEETSTVQASSESCVPTVAKNTANGL